LEDTLTDDLLGCIWWKNHANLQELGIANEKPRFNITQEKREDPQERAAVAQVLASMGVELSLEDVLEQTGFRKPEPGEEVVRQPAQSPLGGLGL
jgi:phage gp29-like protein